MRPKKTAVPFKDATFKSGEGPQTQQALQVVALEITRGGKLFVDYSMKFWLDWCSVRDLYKQSGVQN